MSGGPIVLPPPGGGNTYPLQGSGPVPLNTGGTLEQGLQNDPLLAQLPTGVQDQLMQAAETMDAVFTWQLDGNPGLPAGVTLNDILTSAGLLNFWFAAEAAAYMNPPDPSTQGPQGSSDSGAGSSSSTTGSDGSTSTGGLGTEDLYTGGNNYGIGGNQGSGNQGGGNQGGGGPDGGGGGNDAGAGQVSSSGPAGAIAWLGGSCMLTIFDEMWADVETNINKNALVNVYNQISQINLCLSLTSDLQAAILSEASLEAQSDYIQGALDIAGGVAGMAGGIAGSRIGGPGSSYGQQAGSMFSGAFQAAGQFVAGSYTMAEAPLKALQEILKTFLQLAQSAMSNSQDSYKNDMQLFDQFIQALMQIQNSNIQAYSYGHG